MGKVKPSIKSTYPPPADGPCVLFLCKSGCSANEPAAQAGRGPLQGGGICTECKFCRAMKRACTAALGKVIDGVLLECPVPLGENFESVGFGEFSKARTISLVGGLVGSGKRFNFL